MNCHDVKKIERQILALDEEGKFEYFRSCQGPEGVPGHPGTGFTIFSSLPDQGKATFEPDLLAYFLPSNFSPPSLCYPEMVYRLYSDDLKRLLFFFFHPIRKVWSFIIQGTTEEIYFSSLKSFFTYSISREQEIGYLAVNLHLNNYRLEFVPVNKLILNLSFESFPTLVEIGGQYMIFSLTDQTIFYLPLKAPKLQVKYSATPIITNVI